MRFGFFIHSDTRDRVRGTPPANWDSTNWSNVTGTGNKANCNEASPTYDCNSWLPIPLKDWVLKAFDPKYNAYSVFLWANIHDDGSGVTFNLVKPDGINQDYMDRLNEAYDIYIYI